MLHDLRQRRSTHRFQGRTRQKQPSQLLSGGLKDGKIRDILNVEIAVQGFFILDGQFQLIAHEGNVALDGFALDAQLTR